MLLRCPSAVLAGLAWVCISAAFSQGDETKKTSEVNVVTVNGFGDALPDAKVNSFIDESGHDFGSSFTTGKANVPFGKYRVSVESSGSYQGATFEVNVAAPKVLITACLEWLGIENTRVAGDFRGFLKGVVTSQTDRCKASGLYSRLQFESLLGPSDGSFNFGEVPPGIYILTCVAQGKIVILRSVLINASTMPFLLSVVPIPVPLDSQAPQ